MLILTEEAVKQIREAAKQSNSEGLALRLAARRQPDGSIEYLMGFDEQKEHDLEVKSGGVTVVVGAEHAPLLQGATMDFAEVEPGQKSFIFLNPNDPHYVPPGKDETEHRLS